MSSRRRDRRVSIAEQGATAVEYALMLVLIAAVVVAAVAVLGEQTSGSFDCAADQLETQGAATC